MEDKRTCRKCGKVLATRMALQKHLTKVFMCDRKGVRRYKKAMRDTSRAHRCSTCEKTFSSAEALRYHKAKVTPCEPRTKTSSSQRNDLFKCPKCLATFSSKQNLRLHLSRINPCDNSAPKQHDHGNKTCPKCNDTFSSAQNLRLHLTRLIPCDATQPPTPETGKAKPRDENRSVLGQGKALDLSRPQKALKSVVSLNEYLSIIAQRSDASPASAQFEEQVCHKQQKRLETRAATVGLQPRISGKDASSPTYKRKRSASDTGEDMVLVDESCKRVRNASGSAADATDIPSPKLPSHGGNILVDGCCCRHCVRKWTCKMGNRVKYLNGEVTRLRGLIREAGQGPPSNTAPVKQERLDNPTHAASVRCHPDESTTYPLDSGTVASQSMYSSTKAPTVYNDSQDSPSSSQTKDVLIEKYNHANDQILTNERALEDSVAYLKEIPGYDEASSKELRLQLDELRVYIDVEKGKRDEAVATIIAQRWKTKQHEFRFLLENMSVKSKPNAEKAFHEECGEIASQLEEKNKVLSKLGELIGTIGLNAQKYTKLKCSSEVPMPKYAIERTAKSFLERQRDDIFLCLLRSSPRIYMLTKEKLVLFKE